MQVDISTLGETRIYTRDETLVHRLLRKPGFVNLIVGLTSPPEKILYRHLVIRPGKLVLMSAFSSRLFGFDLNPEAAQNWVNEVVKVCHILEETAGGKN